MVNRFELHKIIRSFLFNRDIINACMTVMARMTPSKNVFLLYFQMEFCICLGLSSVSVSVKTCPC